MKTHTCLTVQVDNQLKHQLLLEQQPSINPLIMVLKVYIIINHQKAHLEDSYSLMITKSIEKVLKLNINTFPKKNK